MSDAVLSPDVLAGVLAAHQRWLLGEGGQRAVLVGASLVRASLVCARLDGARLDGARLDGASLVCARLDGARLDGARLDGARLVGASLDGASLVGASLDGASLDGARLDGARLDGASLVGARLDGASLVGASLDGARLDGARLDGASLVGASLDGASLVGASLDGASLDGASLDAIRDDVERVLDAATAEVPALLAALRDGRINGSEYEGTCACLVGTIAKARGCHYRELGDDLVPDSDSLAERWFLGIRVGDTPGRSQIAAITERWIIGWLESREPVGGQSGGALVPQLSPSGPSPHATDTDR